MDDEWNLSKFLSSSGVASRRHAAEMVKEGLVSVNGTVVTNPGTRVTSSDRVVCGGREVKPVEKKVYVMLHKPRGYVCTSQDDHAAKKALDLIDLAQSVRLFSAGRLDKDSEGLILFSNDGDFVNFLTHPRNQIRKTYEVSVERPFSESEIQSFLRGVRDAGETLRALSVTPMPTGKYRFVLGEGKNREIRRMVESCGNRTRRLKRVAVGSLRLGSLDCGTWRMLTSDEVSHLLALGERKSKI